MKKNLKFSIMKMEDAGFLKLILTNIDTQPVVPKVRPADFNM